MRSSGSATSLSSRPRRSQRGKTKHFQAGDIVEVVRGVEISNGTLLRKVEGAKDKWWLVTFSADSEDEEISENVFGRLIKSCSTKGKTSTRHATRQKHDTSSSSVEDTVRSGANDDVRNNSVNSTNDGKNEAGIARPVTFNSETCNGKEIKMKTKSKTMKQKNQGDGARVNTRSSSKRKDPSSFPSLDATPSRKTGGNKKQRRKQVDEQVEKVKLLTGTLYLYRGENARAVFIRKY